MLNVIKTSALTTLLFLSSCSNEPTKLAKYNEPKIEGIVRHVAVFDQCPDPRGLVDGKVAAATLRQYKVCMQELSKLRTDDLREISSAIMKRRADLLSHKPDPTKVKQYIDDGTKLHLLNRFMFDVPDSAPQGSPAFWRLTSYYSEQDSVNYLYPFALVDGALVVRAESLTWSGTGVDAGDQLDEFVYFAEKFSRRKIIK